MKRAVILVTVITSIIFISVLCAPIRKNKLTCSEIPTNVLGEILGPAFNSRYMSISEPQEIHFDQGVPGSLKRAPVMESSFYVEDFYSQEISNNPAWKTNHLKVKKGGRNIAKRSVNVVRQWECSSRIRWHDLGPDYYPRFLRSVECTSTRCWYDMMRCKPRSFTVKLLRRKNRCVKDDFKVGPTGSAGLPNDLKELWIWEERAVNFCCDCAI